jgi:hypothetical protein
VIGIHGDVEGPRVCVAHVLAREDDQPTEQEQRIVSRLEHPHEPVDGGVRIAAAHRLDEGRRDVVVLLAVLVVEKRRLPDGALDDADLERDRRPGSAGSTSSPRHVSRRFSAPTSVAAGGGGDEGDRLRRGRDAEPTDPALRVGEGTLDQRDEIESEKRLQAQHLAAREDRGVDRERRVLRGGADEGDGAILDVGQEGVLL